jgi:hypothetical protein
MFHIILLTSAGPDDIFVTLRMLDVKNITRGGAFDVITEFLGILMPGRSKVKKSNI